MIRLAEVSCVICSSAINRRLRHRTEQRMKRLARLEIERSVLDLDEDVVAEPAIERHEFQVGALDPIRIDVGVVDKRPPHHDAAMRRDGIGEHVGAVGVRAAVILRSGLALAVGLDDEAAEVGNQGVDLVRLAPPPPRDGGVERIAVDRSPSIRGAAALAERYTRMPYGRSVRAYAAARLKKRRGQRQRVGIDAVDDGAVDADGRIRASVILDAGIDAIVLPGQKSERPA